MSAYAERLKAEREHLSDEAVIERALSRIEQDERERAALLAQNAALRAVVERVVAILDEPYMDASLRFQELYLLLPKAREALASRSE